MSGFFDDALDRGEIAPPENAAARRRRESLVSPRRLSCPKCGRVVCLRRDGKIPRHHVEVGWSTVRGIPKCPAGDTRPDEWTSEEDRRP